MFKKEAKRKEAKGNTAKSGDLASATDNVAEYIKSVKLKKQLLGINEEDLWTIVSNIQRYYENRAEKDTALIKHLSDEIYEKDALIAKQKLYIEQIRRAGHDA